MAKIKLRDPQGLPYNLGALLYIVVLYSLGWVGVFHNAWLINGLAVLALAHSMIIASYLLHDCGHNAVFTSAEHNAPWVVS